MGGRWDELEDRLVRLGASACGVAGGLRRSETARHLASQLIKSGTAPAANYAEARAAESRRDFVHKMKICLKELRETMVWLKFLRQLGMGKRRVVEAAIAEADELIAIFVASIATAQRQKERSTARDDSPPDS